MKMEKSTKFSVVNGNKKDASWWHEKYKQIIDKKLSSLNPYDRYSYMSLCLYLVKDFNYVCQLEDNAHLQFQTGSDITSSLARLTPREFMIIFPIKKTYNGNRWKCIDYFSTMKKFSDMDMDSFIGDDNIEEVMVGYDNSLILVFNIKMMCAMSKLYRETNGTDIFDDFMIELGKEPLPKYYQVEMPNGKKVFLDESGKKVAVKKVYPKYLKLVED